MKSSIDRHGVTIRFANKPSADVRAMLKANGFRWQPHSGTWFRSRVAGAADFLSALVRKLNPGRPDGECWTCRDPQGFFRPQGAATPVYCDACWQAHKEHDAQARSKSRAHDDPMGVDTLYEDACARACGM